MLSAALAVCGVLLLVAALRWLFSDTEPARYKVTRFGWKAVGVIAVVLLLAAALHRGDR